MPVHDWTRVEAGIFHDFHHGWIEEIKRALNNGVLPADYYALVEQHAAGFGPDVLTLQGREPDGNADQARHGQPTTGGTGLLLAPPKAPLVAETDMDFYRRKQGVVAVRHVSGDRIVAMVEIVSPGNKASRHALRSFVEKAAQLLERRVHLLIMDLHPPGRRDPAGIHAAIWEEFTGAEPEVTADEPLTLVAYEAALSVRVYMRRLAVGEVLPEMPLFIEPGAHVPVPVESTYRKAFEAVPRRWRNVLEAP